MITAKAMRERNDQLKKESAEQTARNIEKRLFSTATLAVLDRLASGIEERHGKGFPYQDNLIVVDLQPEVNDFELLSVLCNLGYGAERVGDTLAIRW